MKMTYEELPVFESADERVRFRPANDGDIDFIVSTRNSPFVMKRFVYREKFTAGSQKRWMDEKVYTCQVIQYIFGRGEERAGCAWLTPLDDGSGRAEYGVFMDERYAGCGFGTEACRGMTALAVSLGFSGCISRVIADNTASIRMLEKNGYRMTKSFTQKTFPGDEEIEMVLMEYSAPAPCK